MAPHRRSVLVASIMVLVVASIIVVLVVVAATGTGHSYPVQVP